MNRKSFERRGKIAADAALRTSRTPKGAKRELRFRDLVEPALEAKRLRGNEPSSLASDRRRLRRILPVLGHVKASALTPARLELFLQSLARGDALHDPIRGSTSNRYLSLLGSIFRHAQRQGLIVNPLAGGTVPRSKESRVIPRFLTREEQGRLLRAIREENPRKVLEVELSILSGMRRSEQFNAKWEDWKIREGVLYVVGKTGRRAVRVNQAARRCLLRLRKRAAPDAAYITPERNEGPRDSRLWFEKAVKRADLRPAFTWHSMRHTFCSRLVAAGVPLLEVQQLAGHRSFQTTLRYSHLSPGHLKRAVEKVSF
ncbi:MAG: site-specific integrase [Candidatus Acidiferrum sp.]